MSSTTPHPLVATQPDASDLAPWIARIRPHLESTVQAIVASGRELSAAKEALPHGRWLPLLNELGLSARMAERFIRLAQHPAPANATRVAGLPAAIGTLDVLARLDADTLTQAVKTGEVTPSTTRTQAVRIVQRRAPGKVGGEVIKLRVTSSPLPVAEPRASLTPAFDAVEREHHVLTSRRIWEQPARELLRWLRAGHVEVQSPEAAVLLGDLRSALEDAEVPEQYR
jgi:hypothetical protein